MRRWMAVILALFPSTESACVPVADTSKKLTWHTMEVEGPGIRVLHFPDFCVLPDYEHVAMLGVSLPSPVDVRFDGFGDNSVNLIVALYTTVETHYTFPSRAKEAIYNAFHEHGIEIPFPQRFHLFLGKPGTLNHDIFGYPERYQGPSFLNAFRFGEDKLVMPVSFGSHIVYVFGFFLGGNVFTCNYS